MRSEDVNQWTVAIFPKNKEKDFYSVRLFKNVEAALARYGKMARMPTIYMSAGEMQHRLPIARLREYVQDLVRQFSNEAEQYHSSTIRRDSGLTLEEDSADELVKLGNHEALANGLWRICHLIGDQVRGLPDSPENDDKYKVRLDRLSADREVWEKFPNQARIICQALLDFGEPAAEMEELHQLVRDLAKQGKLKTKTDPVAIWRYYAPVLGDHGFIFYPTKRHKLQEHDDEMSNI